MERQNQVHASLKTRWLKTGSLASILSMAVLALHGRRRHGSSVSLINAPSHWLYGDRALRANAPSLRFTVPGALIHHASSLLWALLYEGVLRVLAREKQEAPSTSKAEADQAQRDQRPGFTEVIASASAVTAFAWLVDTRLVPRRLTPGFERRSSSAGLFAIYGAFATGLALAALAVQQRQFQPARRQLVQPAS